MVTNRVTNLVASRSLVISPCNQRSRAAFVGCEVRQAPPSHAQGRAEALGLRGFRCWLVTKTNTVLPA
jgi:hypothetical protein